MKLEVGMIARTTKGLLIDIIHDFDSKLCAYKRDEITKASFNIIDLIEVGDYVNGYKVKGFNDIGQIIYSKDAYGGGYSYVANFKNEDIKSVVTKEQFESNCYKVVE